MPHERYSQSESCRRSHDTGDDEHRPPRALLLDAGVYIKRTREFLSGNTKKHQTTYSTQILRYTNAALHKHCVTQILRCSNTALFKYCVTQLLRCSNTALHKMLCCSNTALQKYCINQIMRYTNTALHKYCINKILHYTNTALIKYCLNTNTA